MTDPLSVCMKVEHCTLFVGCTNTFFSDNDFKNTNEKDDYSYDKRYFGEGKLQYKKIFGFQIFCLFHVKQLIHHHDYKLETDDDNNDIRNLKKGRLLTCKIFGFRIFSLFCVNHLLHQLLQKNCTAFSSALPETV
jgi:hypothetical protein